MLELDLVQGTTYFVFVDSFVNDEGRYVLNLRDGPCEEVLEPEICDDRVEVDAIDAMR